MKTQHWKKLLASSAIALGMSVVGSQEAEAATQTATLNISASVVASCTITAAGINFGVYDVTSPTDVDLDGSVTINCSSGAPVFIDLDDGVNQGAGSTPTAPVRRMASATVPSLMSYSLSAFTNGGAEWGAGDPTLVGTGVGATGSGVDQVITVFGRVGAGQPVLSGAYADTVTATVNY